MPMLAARWRRSRRSPASPRGSARRAASGRGTAAPGLAGPRRRPRRRGALDACSTRSRRGRGARPGPGALPRAREPRAPRRGRDPGDARGARWPRTRPRRSAAWRDLGGGPVALKLDAPGLAHKSDAGGVALGPGRRGVDRGGGRGAARGGARAAGVDGARAARRADGGTGGRADRRRPARRGVRARPCSSGWAGSSPRCSTTSRCCSRRSRPDEVAPRLEGLRGAVLLHGARGRPAVDIDALAALVAAVGDLLVADPSIARDRPQPGHRDARAGSSPWTRWWCSQATPRPGLTGAPRHRPPTPGEPGRRPIAPPG